MDFSESTFPKASLQHLFQERLANMWQEHETITDCKLLNTHYKEFFKEESRHKSYLANAYELTLCDTITNQSRKQILYCKQYKTDYSQQIFGELDTSHAPVHLSDIGMIVWQFPHDPKLPHLSEAVDPAKVKKHLAVPAKILDDVTINVEIVNYRPEIRCTAWYEVENESSGQSLKLFGKTYSDDRYQEIYKRVQWLRDHLDSETFIIPALAGYNDDIKTFWQEKLEGQPLLEVIDASDYQNLLGQAAQRLVTLNTCALLCPTRETNSEQLREVCKKIKKLNQVFPALQERLETLQRHLETDLPRLEPVTHKVVHGDFHLRQMLLHQEQVVLFDFDECSVGDPTEDLAHFIADLYTYSFDTKLVEGMSQSFLEAYTKHSNTSVPTKRLAWHLQIQFINRAYRSYLQQKPELITLVSSYISLAVMNGSTSSTSDLGLITHDLKAIAERF